MLTAHEPLTAQQEQELHDDLEALRQQLEALLKSSKHGAATVELDQSRIGRLSRMDAMQSQQMAQANRRNHQRRLSLVRQSLSAFERGQYGECRSCEEPIGYPRLKTRPESPFCRSCQAASEQR